MSNDRHIIITDEVAEAVCRGAGYKRHDDPVTIAAEDGRLIAEALELFDGVDEGENTDSDELRRLARLVDQPRWTDPDTGYEYATTEQALLQALPAVAEHLDMEPPERTDEIAKSLLASAPVLGSRVKFVRDVDRYPHFQVPAGATGWVTQADEEIYIVRLDEPVPGSEEWNGDVIWCPGDHENPAADIARDYVNYDAIKAMTDQELRDEIAAGGPADADHAMRVELGKREIAQADNDDGIAIERASDEAEAYAEAHDRAAVIFRGDWDANGSYSVHIPRANTAGWLHRRGWELDPQGRWVSPAGLRLWETSTAIAHQLLAEMLQTGEPA